VYWKKGHVHYFWDGDLP
jgi:hypothetical protein